MFAVISLGGKQYRVRKGEYLTVDRLAHDAGSTFSPVVLLATSGDDVSIDAAELAKVTVTARVDEHLLGPKIRVFQYKPKKSSKKARGHRSRLSRITIEEIAIGTAKKAAAKPAAKAAEKPAEVAEAKPAAKPAEKAAAKPAEKAGGEARRRQEAGRGQEARSRQEARSTQEAGGREEARRRARDRAGGVSNGT